MPRRTWRTWWRAALPAAAVLGLNACDRSADSHADAPGGPGSGSDRASAQPAVPGTGLTGSFPSGGTATSAPMGAGPASGRPTTSTRDAAGTR